ncbi:MAG: hypothetical protein ACOVRN_01770 [Flavobacterium sp.]
MERKTTHKFNTQSIVCDVEHVIQKGVYQLLESFMDRYTMLEKTHDQLMRLPTIVDELKHRRSRLYDDAFDVDTDEEVYSPTPQVHDQLFQLTRKLEDMERKYETMMPILDKVLNKLNELSHPVQPPSADVSTIVKSCENEHVVIHVIEEPKLSDIVVKEEKREQEDQVVEESQDELIEEQEEPIEEEEEEPIEEEEQEEEEEEEEEQEQDEVAEEEPIEEEEEEEEQEQEQEQDEVAEEEPIEEEEEQEQDEDPADATECQAVAEEKESEEDVNSVETETKEPEAMSEEEEEDIFEIEIDDKAYCTNDEVNGFIWELTEDGEQGEKVGYFKEEEPFFYADE